MKTFILLLVSGALGVGLAKAAPTEDQDQSKSKPAKTKPSLTQPAQHPPPQAPGHPQKAPRLPQQVPKPRHVSPQPAPANRPPNPIVQTPKVYPQPPAPPSSQFPKPRPVQPPTAPPGPTPPRVRNDDKERRADWHRHGGRERHSWAEACRRHGRQHHDYYWWRRHYTRFALFGTGYYFWDAGYWYPAYGYDPAYNTYVYEAPIYAYNDLEPMEIVASVQAELQRLGYYPFEVDGLMGPETRRAISNYQRDNGLEITSAIDQPTLESLGLE